ncbi:MAG: efflux RND transporter periplasmic adaptor subunit, partial [Thermodesulfobacteriota bacterium]
MMSRKKLAGLATLVVVALIFMVWLAGLWPWGKIAPGTLALKAPPPPEKVLTIREVEIPQELTVLAAVISPSLTHISPQVSGRVSRIFVDAGSPVKQGDSLVALAAPEFQARAGQAQAQLTQVTADYQRYRRLLKEGAVSPREFEAMEARYEAAQAQMQEAAAFQKYTLITAPRTGVVAERRMAVGDLAQPGQTLISLYDPRDLQIEGEVNDDYRAYLKIGAPVRLEVPAANFQTDSTLKEIFPLSAPGSRTFKVRTERVGFEGRAGGPQVPRPPLKLPS